MPLLLYTIAYSGISRAGSVLSAFFVLKLESPAGTCVQSTLWLRRYWSRSELPAPGGAGSVGWGDGNSRRTKKDSRSARALSAAYQKCSSPIGVAFASNLQASMLESVQALQRFGVSS